MDTTVGHDNIDKLTMWRTHSGTWRGIAVVLTIFTAVHLWVIMFIRHRSWQAAEFLDYPLGCGDMQQCARFGSNLFGQSLVWVHKLLVGFYAKFYGDTLAIPRLSGVDVEAALLAEQLTRVIYMTILGVGAYLVFRRLLRSIVGALVAVNGLLFMFSGFYLSPIIRFVDHFDQLTKLGELLRMQQLSFLMHYDYLIVPAYLSTIFVLKRLREHRMTLSMCFGYAFLLGSIYEGLVPVVALSYVIMSIRFRNVLLKYLFVLIAGQATATIVAYASQFGNREVNWVGRSVTTYGADNIEYIPQLFLLFAVIAVVSFGLGYLFLSVLRQSRVIRWVPSILAYRETIFSVVVSLLVLHVFGVAVAGYTNEFVRQSLGFQAMMFTLGLCASCPKESTTESRTDDRTN